MAKQVHIEAVLGKAFRKAMVQAICETLMDEFFEQFLPNNPIIVAVGKVDAKAKDRSFLKSCGIKSYY
jgi:hypothetical protein